MNSQKNLLKNWRNNLKLPEKKMNFKIKLNLKNQPSSIPTQKSICKCKDRIERKTQENGLEKKMKKTKWWLLYFSLSSAYQPSSPKTVIFPGSHLGDHAVIGMQFSWLEIKGFKSLSCVLTFPGA